MVAVVTGVDTDLATLRRIIESVRPDAVPAVARVEAELSRLRGLIEGSATDEAILQAAEARCARLQQALREIDRHLTSTGGSLSPRHADHWRAREAAREALAAGPDTPADSQPEEPTT
jgi:hypothetical protein